MVALPIQLWTLYATYQYSHKGALDGEKTYIVGIAADDGLGALGTAACVETRVSMLHGRLMRKHTG